MTHHAQTERLDQITQGDQRLIQLVDAAWRLGAERARHHLVCRPGCFECCIGLFPINRLDAWRLARGLERLERTDPARAGEVLRRAAESADKIQPHFPGDSETGRLEGKELEQDWFFEHFAHLPCPALDPSSGTCDLYEFRPLSCRAFGLPVRYGGEELEPCRICFTESTPGEIEESRIEPGGEDLEQDLLERLTAMDGGPTEAETLVAFALLESVTNRKPRKEEENRT